MVGSAAVAVVRPFRAVRYDERAAGPLASLVAPPYDVISLRERDEYRARSPYNVVHLTLPDSEDEAARAWSEWHAGGILVSESEPSFWAVRQDYVGPDGVARTRTGIFGSLRLEPYESGGVFPHERTHRGPKEGRLRLLRATRVQLEPIFLLYEGGTPFKVPDGDPDVEAEGTRLWRLGHAPDVTEAFANRKLLIADGHHRYETALAYHAEQGTPESAFMPVVLVATHDPGLTIFPTHRIAQELDGRRLPAPDGDPRRLLDELAREPSERAAAVLYRGGGAAKLYGGEDELDVELVARYAPSVSYTANADEAISAVDDGRAEAAFLVRPLAVEDVFAAATAGRVMPQKTTYFYPKLLSGLLFHPV